MRISAVLPIIVFSYSCVAQSPVQQSGSTFEVASVKLSSQETILTPGRRIQTSPGSLVTRGLPLRECIVLAYNSPTKIIGPDWLAEVHLDIAAKAATPAGDKDLYAMLRTLLANRLGLRAHFEKREMPVYALAVAKGGPKFTESGSDSPVSVRRDKGAVLLHNVSMSDLAVEVSRIVDRPVVDATGLKARYDLRMDVGAVAAVSQEDRMDAATSMITALQEQMGLRLEARKDSIDVLVIDHVEKIPTEN